MTNEDQNDIQTQERALERRREDLLADKRAHEEALDKLKSAIRIAGRMEDSKYKQYRDAQERHVTALARIEEQLRPLR